MTPPSDVVLDEAASRPSPAPPLEIRPDRILALRRALLRGQLVADPDRIASALRARGAI